MINIVDYIDLKYNIVLDEFKIFLFVFIVYCNGDYDVFVEESEYIMNYVLYLIFECVNKNEYDFDCRFNDEVIIIYCKVVDFLNVIIMM